MQAINKEAVSNFKKIRIMRTSSLSNKKMNLDKKVWVSLLFVAILSLALFGYSFTSRQRCINYEIKINGISDLQRTIRVNTRFSFCRQARSLATRDTESKLPRTWFQFTGAKLEEPCTDAMPS